MKTYHAFLSILALAMGMFVCASSPVMAVDCQPNGIDDECDLDCAAQAGACNVLGCGLSCDCNNNGTPDECEIVDVAWVGGDGNWNTASNWSSGSVPDDCLQGVTISGVVTVGLDIDPTMYSLVIEDRATLNVTAEGEGAHTLSIGCGGLKIKSATMNKSTLNVLNGSTIDVLAGPVTIGPAGVYQPHPSATSGEASVLQAASITILEGDPPGEMVVEFDMQVQCTGDFEMDGRSDYTCPQEEGGGVALRGGLTPPILGIGRQVIVGTDGNLSLQGSPTVDIDGKLWLRKSVSVELGASATINLAGDFANESEHPKCFDANNGAMVLDGSGPQTYEAAGALFETPTEVFQNNFAFGSLTVSARLLSETVTFQDDVDNVPGGIGPLDFEWFFVNGLTLENATVTVLNCGVAFDALSGDSGSKNVTVTGEGVFTSITSLFSQVPTASQWGVTVLVLALLTAATIGIRRCRRASA